MPRISTADLEQLIDSEDEFVDKRERVREKKVKNRFKENFSEGHDSGKHSQH